MTDWAERALAESQRSVYWTDRPGAPETSASWRGQGAADLVIVGGGLAGLWTAIEALQADPGRDVVILESRTIAFGAAGRNGGFISASLTHGHAHGAALWPNEMDRLVRLGHENLDEIEKFCISEGIGADIRICGKTAFALTPHSVAALPEVVRINREYGEAADLLDGDEARSDVHSPAYLGGVRIRTGSGLMDPARLTWGLTRAALARGARIHEHSAVTGLEPDGAGVRVTTTHGSVHARQVILATNAYPPLLRRLGLRFLPIFDHVLVTEPLSQTQVDAIGWRDNQGLTDGGNQFHYYRRTPDDRILWGGWDANYYRGNRTDESLEDRRPSFLLLAQQFHQTFPQLEEVRFSHRWAGIIDSTSRFTPAFGTAMRGRVAYAVGYTGLGTAMSRFGARVCLDLLAGRDTERTSLTMVRRRPFPFPPEPLRNPLVQFTRSRLAREDVTGRRGLWLRTLDAFGLGFNS
jgi:glycine/D-amino acid oxidase-like deaminating enzyme